MGFLDQALNLLTCTCFSFFACNIGLDFKCTNLLGLCFSEAAPLTVGWSHGQSYVLLRWCQLFWIYSGANQHHLALGIQLTTECIGNYLAWISVGV